MPTPFPFRFLALCMALTLFTPAPAPANAQQAGPERAAPPLLGAVSDNGKSRDPDRGDLRLESGAPAGPVELVPQAAAERRASIITEAAPRPPRAIVPSEFENFLERTLGRKLARFGNDLLLPDARDFALPATATVPPDYLLGPGDNIDISLNGSIEGNFNGSIDNDGRLFLPRVGPVMMAGVRYGDLRARVTAVIGKQFRNFSANVTVKQLRGIRVYVTGFAASPGGYTVSSLSTMVNAVLAAGGPAAGGSFRKAVLMRGNRQVAELDLYDLLLRGDRTHDVVLQNEDVITIAPMGDQVAMIGSVNAEAVYETKSGETLDALLKLAGGPAVLADTSRLVLFRTRDSEALIGREITRLDATQEAVLGGDIVSVLASGSLLQPQNRQAVLVRLEGEVARPGNYLVKPGSRLDALMEQAGGLTVQAFPFGARLERLSVKLQQRAGFREAVDQLELSLAATPLTSASLSESDQARALASAKAVLDRLRAADPDGRLVMDIPANATDLPGSLTLENNDRIVVPPRPSAVGVFGAVYRPASFLLLAEQGLRVRDYIIRAGGPIRAADTRRLFVVRANGEVLTHKMGALDAPALPGDVIFMPVKTQINNLWARIRDISAIIFQLGITTAALVAITQ